MSEVERAPIPRLLTRSSLLWVGGTAAAVIGIVVYYGITQPENRWAAVAVAAAVLAAALWFVSVRTWVEPDTGTVVREAFWCRRRRAGLGSATSVSLVNNRGGALLFEVRDRRTLYMPVLTLTDYVERSQSPAVLRLLAEQIDTHAPRARPVADQLRTQADFIADGGPATQSPLAGLITHGAIRAAKAGGAGGLLD